MLLDSYFSLQDGWLQFTRKQASDFAKAVAHDFNPIHDEDNKRFCVPGDLLFSFLLNKKGLSSKMHVDFSGLVTEKSRLTIDNKDENSTNIIDKNNKEYLRLHQEGQITHDHELIKHFVTNYVLFSGSSFPYVLVPLMQEKGLMINPIRPLVIYDSMKIEFNHLNLSKPEIIHTGSLLSIEGKRGTIDLFFEFKENGETVGKGEKRMLASNLQPYNAEVMNELIQKLEKIKEAY